jgi:hypothetical protein
MEHNIFREHKVAIVLVDIISLPACAFAVYMKTWPLAVISGVSFVSITVGLILTGIKDRREKVADSKHSDEFKRIKRAGDDSYEYAYTEYYKDSFDKIYDWERSEFEDLIWTKYQNRIIKLAYLLPYLKKYDGMSRLQVDLASPSTPDGHKSIIADALDQAARYPA